MEEIVRRLSEIETEAVRIMDDSAVAEKEMDAELGKTAFANTMKKAMQKLPPSWQK